MENRRLVVCNSYFRDDDRIGIAGYDKESDEWSFYLKRNNQFVKTEVSPNVHIVNSIQKVIDAIVIQYAKQSENFDLCMKPHITSLEEETCVTLMKKKLLVYCYGAIWSSNGLLYVARMDYKGVWNIL